MAPRPSATHASAVRLASLGHSEEVQPALSADVRYRNVPYLHIMLDSVRAMLAVPRDPDAPGIRVWDWVLATLVLLLALHQRTSIDGELSWLAIGMTVIVALAVPWRRLHPLLANIAYLSAYVAANFVHSMDQLEGMMLAGVLINYALLRWASGRQSAIGFILLLATYASRNIVFSEASIYDGTVATGLWLLPTFVGGTMRYLAENRRRLVEDARFGERMQLARELHDTVAHHVSAIAVQAQAGRVAAAAKPQAATEALRVVELTASRALLEMRKVVGALRTAEADMEPQQRLSDIERLAKESQGGPRIDVSFSGPLQTLKPWQEVGLYRVAQESITNARRHAHNASHVAVSVDCNEETVCLTVADDGENKRRAPRPSAGHGLVGMEERVKLMGGQFEAGPNPEGGWLVRATVPRAGEL